MIKKVKYFSKNKVVVIFTDRSPLVVTSDNDSAAEIVDRLLSPRWDMGYSQYLTVVEMEDEITQEIIIEAVIAS